MRGGGCNTNTNTIRVYRADFVWQLEVPVMVWSGSTVCHESQAQREQYYSLKVGFEPFIYKNDHFTKAGSGQT
jgi:hypothetical protein|eukprot:COSAG06_NODE_182_length_20899_cov_89.175048_9_plen_73_part_00